MNCDRIARWYRTLERLTFGRALERRRVEYLEQMADARRVLILGDGDGWFTAAFLERNRVAEVDSVDLSAGMLDVAARRVGRNERVRFHHADARSFALRDEYDLLVTHFFLDCLTEAELKALVPRLSEALREGGRWVVSEFHVPAKGPRRWFARVVVRFLYGCFRLTTGLEVRRLPDHAAIFEANGLRRIVSRTAVQALLISELWQRGAK